MFWRLLLAHFLADFPLQSAWMVANKKRPPVLMLHAGIHFVVMLLVTAPAWRELWPYCLILAFVHFWIDYGKIFLSTIRPQWVAMPYLIDQFLHYLTLAAATWWIGQTRGELALLLDPQLAVLATGYLLVTHVWAISEKILTSSQPEFRRELVSGFWPRMIVRALLLSGLLWLQAPGSSERGRAALGVALPYFSGQYARRALLTDVLVAAGVWLLMISAFGQLANGL